MINAARNTVTNITYVFDAENQLTRMTNTINALPAERKGIKNGAKNIALLQKRKRAIIAKNAKTTITISKNTGYA